MSFVSVMKAIGHDIDWLFHTKAFVIGEQVAVSAASIFAPAAAPLLNLIIGQVTTTEANFASISQQNGTGVQKLAAVMSTSGNVIQTMMKDLGIQNVTAQKAEELISAVVTILNNIPANPQPASSPA